ncbi:helix-turn-helix transcriptional regulator [Fodinicola acaciae]|uniref:helix-turn-helix transcriptional regulator n=1 Tax=Fodinicola acaciae TaxID=2681555 RepID=UPI0013D693A9|nr:AraC family transcriptional regulator [Fodinicola acaciae]
MCDWPGMRSEYNWLPPAGSVTRTKPHQVGVSFTAHRGAVFGLPGRSSTADIRAGAVFVTGSEEIIWTEIGETAEALEIYPSDVLLRSMGGSGDAIAPAMAADDATVLAAASILRRAHLTGTPMSDMAASTVAHRLAGHLLERYAGIRQDRQRVGRLDAKTVDRVAEYVDARLGGQLTLDALAAVAALSPYHFARGFKATTGMAPHQFVTARRVDRARALLLGSSMSVAEIAHEVGLSNVRHFRQLFRRQLGVLPGELRKIRPSPVGPAV